MTVGYASLRSQYHADTSRLYPYMDDDDDDDGIVFASDPLNLTLASPALNGSDKKHYDGAEWMPPMNKCWFAQRIVEVRQKYGLTIDRPEAEALERILSACSSVPYSALSG